MKFVDEKSKLHLVAGLWVLTVLNIVLTTAMSSLVAFVFYSIRPGILPKAKYRVDGIEIRVEEVERKLEELRADN